MAKKMLIDATHNEEVRVAVVDGNRLEDFDTETSTKKQIKGNIYLAKIIRIEPSLQAAFVEFGGNRHGFLPFSEIHPDYYRIPVADRDNLDIAEATLAFKAAMAKDKDPVLKSEPLVLPSDEPLSHESIPDESLPADLSAGTSLSETKYASTEQEVLPQSLSENAGENLDTTLDLSPDLTPPSTESFDPNLPADSTVQHILDYTTAPLITTDTDASSMTETEKTPDAATPTEIEDEDLTEDDVMQRPRVYRYKIQEVIKRRQIILIQVVKEERGNKGAALTTYLSLPGRYCVLMPNAGHRSGGVSRKISDPQDRKRLRDVLKEFNLLEGMSLIVRTAGQERNKLEIRRDFEYLLRLWSEIREATLKSIAPTLVYAEGDLIKRTIRDCYGKEVNEIIVEGDEAYKAAKTFMKMLMPSHARRVQHYKDASIPLFQRFQVEDQIDLMMQPTAMLPSGGSIVINPTEALVAIDVNSGRSTRERHIDDTALKTNLEAADEIARQMRLRDLGGLIVIDFIDMSDTKNIQAVEKRLKDAVRNDRARIQIGRISQFGLMEMSRQRLRPSIIEANTTVCHHCRGSGVVRSVESMALHVLRAIEAEGILHRSAEIKVSVPKDVDLYLLNQKRSSLVNMETRYAMSVMIHRDDTLIAPDFQIECAREQTLPPPAIAPITSSGWRSAPDLDIMIDEEDGAQETPLETNISATASETTAASETTVITDEGQPQRDGRRNRRKHFTQRRRGDGHTRPPHNGDGESQTTLPENKTDAAPSGKTRDAADTSEQVDTQSQTAVDGPRDPQRRRRRRRPAGARQSQTNAPNNDGEVAISASSERIHEHQSTATSVTSIPQKKEDAASTETSPNGKARRGWLKRLFEG